MRVNASASTDWNAAIVAASTVSCGVARGAVERDVRAEILDRHVASSVRVFGQLRDWADNR